MDAVFPLKSRHFQLVRSTASKQYHIFFLYFKCIQAQSVLFVLSSSLMYFKFLLPVLMDAFQFDFHCYDCVWSILLNLFCFSLLFVSRRIQKGNSYQIFWQRIATVIVQRETYNRATMWSTLFSPVQTFYIFVSQNSIALRAVEQMVSFVRVSFWCPFRAPFCASLKRMEWLLSEQTVARSSYSYCLRKNDKMRKIENLAPAHPTHHKVDKE